LLQAAFREVCESGFQSAGIDSILAATNYTLLAKDAQDAKVWNVGIRNIVGWLRSLRAPGNRKRG
jgi:hypothetical protein